MVVGVGARQFERFAATSFAIDVGYERTCVVAIITTTAEHHPSSIARPRVVALGIGGVDFFHVAHLARLEVQHPKVGIVMPDVEDARLGKGEHQEAAIRRYARQSGAFVEGISGKDKFTWPELQCLGVETLLIDVVFHNSAD